MTRSRLREILATVPGLGAPLCRGGARPEPGLCTYDEYWICNDHQDPDTLIQTIRELADALEHCMTQAGE